jgi:hypothetical protein
MHETMKSFIFFKYDYKTGFLYILLIWLKTNENQALVSEIRKITNNTTIAIGIIAPFQSGFSTFWLSSMAFFAPGPQK